jgi:hypothetical protein
MNRFCLGLLAVLCLSVATPAIHAQRRPGFGQLYYNGQLLHTVVPPAAFPNQGRDQLFRVVNGVEDQRGIAAVAPGDRDYHGGHWAVYIVTFNMGKAPTLLTSAEEVEAAVLAGDVMVDRNPAADFLCPLQPNRRK